MASWEVSRHPGHSVGSAQGQTLWLWHLHLPPGQLRAHLDELWTLWVVDEEAAQVCWQHVEKLVEVILHHHLLGPHSICIEVHGQLTREPGAAGSALAHMDCTVPQPHTQGQPAPDDSVSCSMATDRTRCVRLTSWGLLPELVEYRMGLG